MPVVSSFDGLNRRIFLDPSVAGAEFDPLDIYREYLAFRRDNEAFRGFDPLIKMKGGEPKSATTAAARFLQLLTDRRGITTKLVLPDSGPYRVGVGGEIATDVPETDPEPFDLSGLTTTGIVIDYRPVATEIVILNGTGGGLSTAQSMQLLELWRLQGLDAANPMTVTPTSRVAGPISQTITGDGENTSTVTRT